MIIEFPHRFGYIAAGLLCIKSFCVFRLDKQGGKKAGFNGHKISFFSRRKDKTKQSNHLGNDSVNGEGQKHHLQSSGPSLWFLLLFSEKISKIQARTNI